MPSSGRNRDENNDESVSSYNEFPQSPSISKITSEGRDIHSCMRVSSFPPFAILHQLQWDVNKETYYYAIQLIVYYDSWRGNA